MMDRVLVEIVAPRQVGEMRREAAHERLLIAAAQPLLTTPVRALGATLIRVGARLEQLGAPCVAGGASIIAPDPCRCW